MPPVHLSNSSKFLAVGSSQRPWRPVNREPCTYNGALDAVSAWANFGDLRSADTDPATGRYRIGPVDPSAYILWRPWIDGDPGKIAQIRCWGIAEASDELIVEYQADQLWTAGVQAGAAAVPAGARLASPGSRWADAITVSFDETGGLLDVLGESADVGYLILPTNGYPLYLVQMTLTEEAEAPAGVGLQYRLL